MDISDISKSRFLSLESPISDVDLEIFWIPEIPPRSKLEDSSVKAPPFTNRSLK